MNVPNFLTLIRFLLIPVFCIIYFSNMNYSFFLSMIIFFIAGITDLLDGYIARKYDLVTKIGTVLDPLADKFMTLTVLFCLAYKDIIPHWIVFPFLIKELIMVIGGINLYKYERVLPANHYGKTATILFYISIFMLIFNKTLGTYLLYLTLVSAVLAFVNYLKHFLNIKSSL
ncbi:cardiolipin synthase [Caloramator quimbayensis]|uniref:CDP-diacylglycerol--glycerol-3-phosphate 3-phosphatidyltransferase n=1 Tax=Caloramator quimbayensis TaxID=1147123 RepID=A0A1T4Y5J5_9CLOT|nr:CDP-diacylglycerol--glycerol-3-phosphate 3-phosphatidyltransferase [Caloramator quimbayensis]SKA97039.1 cardiolipin synthase [Caloramator quimbayensis]